MYLEHLSRREDGQFQIAQKLMISCRRNCWWWDTDLTISNVESFKFEDVRSVFMSDDDDTGQNFTADGYV